MNDAIRKKLVKIREELELLQGKIQDISSEVEVLRDDEQEKFDNMTEGLQQTERGQLCEAASQALDEVFNGFESISGSFDDIFSNLDDASQ